jgi:Protein of unknown function (DUF1634)
VNNNQAQILKLETLLARLMLAGVAFSALSLAAGLVLWLAGRQTRLLDVGLIALLVTPMLRVAVSFLEAIRMRDWFFVGATLTVVVLLSASLVLSFRAAGL